MSKILGSEDRRWSLARAVDALTESARVAGRPSLLWFAGFFYPGVGLGLGLGWSWILRSIGNTDGAPASSILAPMRFAWLGAKDPLTGLLVGTVVIGCMTPMLFPLLLPLFRVIAGLAGWAAGAAPASRGRLRDAWRAGRGNVLSSGALWVQCWVLVVAATAVFLAPVVAFLREVAPAAAKPAVAGELPRFIALVVSGPSALIVLVYVLAISILFQLALHSLAQNRRGAGSALVHAWRLARHDPWATVRALLGDSVLSLVHWIAFWVLLALWHVPVLGGFAIAAYVALGGFIGVARALYWSRAYRALGGLSPADGVPGLAGSS
ncbi:MAG: hypothetical protein K8S98_07125 [Planctomycetes bacterium]|nr:hypothetical protein [Planctomycetota bacterium]